MLDFNRNRFNAIDIGIQCRSNGAGNRGKFHGLQKPDDFRSARLFNCE